METVCDLDTCMGCMACVESCSMAAIAIVDSLEAFNAVIDQALCIKCGACRSVCPQSNPARMRGQKFWFQGWAISDKTRSASSSGGVAASISKEFIEKGGIVCSCAFEKGRFGFSFADDIESVKKFAGSKYVKSDPSGCYRATKELLKKGRNVLFLGLPCQVSALKMFIGDQYSNLLVTVDLICHGTPSSRLLEIYLEQQGVSVDEVVDIQFRKKNRFQLRENERYFSSPGVCDSYLIAFLNSLSYTKGCYSCPFARRERVADITLGDSWGTLLGVQEARKGVSLVLCQTLKGLDLLRRSEVHLEQVDLELAIKNNQQLTRPSAIPCSRSRFFKRIKAGENFADGVRRCLPKQCFKQDVKHLLIKFGLWRRKSEG